MSFSSWGSVVIVGLGVLSFVAFVGLYVALTADPNPPPRVDRCPTGPHTPLLTVHPGGHHPMTTRGNTMTTTETRLTTFVYLLDGQPHVGTVTDLARALEESEYVGVDVDRRVWTFEPDSGTVRYEPVTHLWKTMSSGYNDDDYAAVTVEIEFVKGDPEVASYRVDGRA